MGRAVLNGNGTLGYMLAMLGMNGKIILFALAFVLCAGIAQAQTARQKGQQRTPQPAAPAVPVDPRDSVVAAAGSFAGRPYWLVLAQCGGIYFKLNALYTEAAVHARVVAPDPTANAEFSKKLSEAMKTATTYLDGAEHFLMTDRGVERPEAVLTYDPQMRAAGERLKTIDAALAAAKACPALYQICREAYPKLCIEPLGSAR